MGGIIGAGKPCTTVRYEAGLGHVVTRTRQHLVRACHNVAGRGKGVFWAVTEGVSDRIATRTGRGDHQPVFDPTSRTLQAHGDVWRRVGC
jgi:hypothetical protein